MKYIFLDTSSLMQSPEGVDNLLEREKAIALVCSVVLDELDKHKDFGDGERNYKARQAFKLINKLEEEDRILIAVQENATLPSNFDMRVPDNKILACLKAMKNTLKNVDIELLTYDNGMKAKAKLLGIPTITMQEEDEEENYKGYIEIYGTEEENDEALYAMLETKKLHANEYVIIHDTDTDSVSAVRWDAKTEEFVDIHYKSSRVKPLNIYQACAMDLLYNDKIPIKVIAGTYGAGKSKLAVNMMEERIYSGLYDKMLLLRNPIAVDETEIGYLPGDFYSKLGHFFTPMTQYLTNDSMYDVKEAFDPANEDAAKRRGYQLDMDIVQNLKGVSVDRTIVILDEAEDLSLKLIKVAGTRIGKGSMFVMMGDIKNQTEKKYKIDNGLSAFIDQSKDEPLVGVMYLPVDVRSEMSKIFADLK